MKIRTIILGIIVSSVVVTAAVVLVLTKSEGKGLEDTVQAAAIEVGLDGAEDSLKGVAGGVLASLDHVMEGQYASGAKWSPIASRSHVQFCVHAFSPRNSRSISCQSVIPS